MKTEKNVIRMEDIARLANVSKSAASLALNGKPGVSNETRAHVLEIAQKHNYVPLRNLNKKNEDSSTNYVIRFVACKTNNIITENYQSMPFFNELLGYFTNELKNYPFSLLISSVNLDSFQTDLELIEQEQKSDGIFLLGTNLNLEEIDEVFKLEHNLVVIDTCALESNLDYVAINNYQGAFQAAKYLIDNGHRQIGYGRAQNRIYNFDERQRGFSESLAKHGLIVNENNIFNFHGMKVEDEFSHQINLNRDSEFPTAIFCENDYIAISLMKSLAAMKLRVPEDISIIGFDNISASKLVSPELTTVYVNKQKIAQESLRIMLEKLDGSPVGSIHSFVNTSLIERQSVRTL